MGRKRRQENTIPQKINKNRIEDLVESKRDEFPVADLRRMMIRMFIELKEELKEGIQKQCNEAQENMDKKLEKLRNN
jgi:hypothetical protein